jgi:type 2 lantibiotic biosynthesis protein LanM
MKSSSLYQPASPEKREALLKKLISLPYPSTYPETEIPFGHIFAVWAEFAEKELKAKGLFELLLPKAQKKLREKLIKQLSDNCAPTFAALLQLAKMENKLEGETGRERYHFYIEKIFPKPDYLTDLFHFFPPLARTISSQILLWIEQAHEFLSRLDKDQTGKGKVADLSVSLSDLHNGNRSVYQVTFENGISLIYKPKSLGLDKAYNRFIEQINQLGLEPKLKSYQVWDHGDYGWVEFVHTLPCHSKEEVSRYFERFGMLICIMFLLEGTDCHYENMLASGEDPVLIDLESLFHPTLKRTTTGIAVWNESVFRTGFLPGFGQSIHQRIDISPLTAEEIQESPKATAKWKDLNTDSMQFVFEKQKKKMSVPRPKLEGKLVSSADYIEELLRGFKKLYLLFSSHKKQILSLIEPLFDYPVRCIFRPTMLYFQILQRMTSPQLMRSENEVQETLEILMRYSPIKDFPQLKEIVGVEKQAISHLDIPFFLSLPIDTHIYLGKTVVAKDCFKEPAKKRVVEKIQTLSADDMHRQMEYIDHSLYFLKMSEQPKYEYHPFKPTSIPLLTDSELHKIAEQIGQKVLDLALPLNDGQLSWLGLEYEPKVDRYVFQPLSSDFYSGEAGIALFLASLGKQPFTQRAEEVLNRLKQPYYEDPEANLLTSNLGGMTGLGGLIYVFSLLGHTKDALYLASLINQKKIEADTNFDLLLGSAGVILVLLSLYEKTGEKSVLEKAKEVGNYLLAKAHPAKEGLAWGEKDLCGLSHGVAGISYALFKLSAFSKESAYSNIAKKALEYERSCYAPQYNNWPDLRYGKEVYDVFTWCHGAPGIGLSRLYIKKYYSDAMIDQEIAHAIQATISHMIGSVDHLCCGNFGRIAFLWEAGQREIAGKQTALLVQRFKEKGNFRFFEGMSEELRNPSFMRGLSGIGYFLLKWTKSGEKFPQILMID